MKKFLFYIGVIISFFQMLSEIMPRIKSFWTEYKEKKASFDLENSPKEETVDMQQDADGVFKASNQNKF